MTQNRFGILSGTAAMHVKGHGLLTCSLYHIYKVFAIKCIDAALKAEDRLKESGNVHRIDFTNIPVPPFAWISPKGKRKL